MVSPLLDLTELDGENGFAIVGLSDFGNLGEAVSNAGDVNGDGFDDLIIGAPEAGTALSSYNPDSYGSYQGEAYIVFGNANGFNATLNLNNLNGSNGFVVRGLENLDNLSEAVSNAGDINGDGLDDLIIGAPFAGETVSTSEGYSYNDNRGQVYVIFGNTSGFAPEFDLNSLDGSNGLSLKGLDSSDNLGAAVSSAGDINGDGFDDFAVGAPNAKFGDGYSSEGEVYIIFGNSNGLTANFDLNSLDGNNGFIVPGINSYGNLGEAISNAGDINGDGFDDLIIGASYAGEAITSPYGYKYSSSRGEAYVIFGSSNGFAPEFDLNNLDGSNGFVVRGLNSYDNLGRAVSSAGDVNGDGIDDIIIGAPNVNVGGAYSSEGEAYVIFGGSNGFAPEFDLNSLDGSNGFSVIGLGSYDNLGTAVSSAGDVDGDGFDDIIVGAPDADVSDAYSNEGEAYIVFGKEEGFTASVDLADINSDRGAAIQGVDDSDSLGTGVSNAGDINGDGLNDLIVGAPAASDDNRGTAYVVFGFQPLELLGTAADDTLLGSSGSDSIFGLGGNDSLEGFGGNDELLGGLGKDS
ncbi:integrin alpha, partial [Myxosarcina sp. GI1]|uniref:integrin alpha n=1 Tax=Myxosarcina sp. GI1 TaxID=1541065 RepID=UPI00056A7B3E